MDSNVTVRRTPDLIAAEINSIKNQTRKMVLYNSIEIGRRLVEAKEMVPHGEWGEWLQGSVDYSQRTANNLMRIFNEYGSEQITLLDDNAKSQALANLSYTQAVALLGVPEEEREQFIEENDIDSMSTRELQQKIEKYKQLANEKSEEVRKLMEEKQKAESDAQLSERVLRETQADVKMLQEEMEALRKRAQEAEAKGNTDEVERLQESLEKTDNELHNAQKKIEELERQLKEKPIEATVATVEKIPEEVEKELNELRKKAHDNTAILKYTVHFGTLVKGFKDLLADLEEIKNSDSEAYKRYKNAVVGLIGKMSERL